MRELNRIESERLGRILTYDVSPMRPHKFETVPLFEWNEALAYQHAWRAGIEDAEDENRAKNR